MAIELSVVIPVRNGAATIDRQIRAIRPQLTADAELVVVDNASDDGTASAVERHLDHPRIRMVSEPTRGANSARNTGVRAAEGALILMCDADDEVQPGWLEAMRRTLVTADLIGSPIDPIDEHGRPRPFDPKRFNLWGFGAPFGCSCGFTRAAWARAGGFDERMVGGFEEFDFFLRAQLLGSRLAWADDTSVTYTVSTDEAKRRARHREADVLSRRSYWMGRRLGYPSERSLLRDLWFLASRVPFILHSPERRRAWTLTALRRIDRLRGFVRFGAAELISVHRNAPGRPFTADHPPVGTASTAVQ